MNRICMLALMLVVAGCIYVPPVWDIGDEIYGLDFIEPGVTSKEQVLESLGEPDTSTEFDGKILFIYRGEKSAGGLFGYPTGDIAYSWWMVAISFDENDLVSAVRTHECSNSTPQHVVERRIALRDREKFSNLDFIEPGVTTKKQVLESLGEPDTSPKFAGGRNYFIYRGEKSGGGIISCPTTNIARPFWRVVVEFDENDLVSSVRTHEW